VSSGRVDAAGVDFQTAANPTTVLEIAEMDITLPDTLKDYVDAQVAALGHGTRSDYVRELIRKDQDQMALKALVMDGLASPVSERSHEDLIEEMRSRIRGAASR
jgi:antitoxin ParD1/3/4